MKNRNGMGRIGTAKAVTAVVLAIVLAVGNLVFYLNVDALSAYFSQTGYAEDSEEAIAARESGNALAARVAAEGVVLLKNDNNVLPLKTRKVNVFGWAGSDDGFLPQGTGSGAGSRNDLVTFLGGLREAGIEYNAKLAQAYDNLGWNRLDGGSYFVEAHGSQYQNYYGVTEAPESFYTEELMADAVAYSDTAVIVLGRLMGEGNDFSKVQYFSNQTGGGEDPTRKLQSLSAREEYTIDLVCESFENVVIVINSGNPLELGVADDPRVDAVLNMGMPGTRGTIGVAKVLTGEVNPSGKLADTWAYDISTAAAYATAGKDANKYTDVGVAYTEYLENIYNGYLWYETADAEGFWNSDFAYQQWGVRGYEEVVQYPFGFGLSYTTFDWELKECNLRDGDSVSKNDTVKMVIRVINTGEAAGRDVVELYYSAPYTSGGIEKSAIKLGGFAKTPTIEPGQFADVVIEMPIEEMKSYDCYDANNNGFMGYELEKGSYTISLRTDVHTLKAGMEDNTMTLKVAEDIRYEVDSVTGTAVTNRFTTYTNPVSGASSQINEPFLPTAHSMDGSENEGGPLAYMTRADFVGTFPMAAFPNKAAGDLFADMHKNTQGREPADPNVTKAPVFGSTETHWKIRDLFGVPYDSLMWDEITSQLTYEEALHFLIDGIGTIALESIDKPATSDTDGPCGFNTNMTGEDNQKAVCYPGSTVIAQTWDWYAVYQVGVAIGMEGNALGINGWYGPGANTHRSALGGRNFEYYSEDAFLSGIMCAYHCLGAKERGIQVYIKHIGPNEDDNGRNGAYKWLTEQALRENYLKPFEMAIKKGANGLMASVTRTGGMRTTGSYALQTAVVRDEWGFRGTIITDYYQSGDINDFDEGIRAGNTQVLWPDYRDDILDDITSDTAKYYVHKSVKDMLYAYADTMFYAETAQGLESGALVGTLIETAVEVFPWWILGVTVLNAVAFGVILSLVIPKDWLKKNPSASTEKSA